MKLLAFLPVLCLLAILGVVSGCKKNSPSLSPAIAGYHIKLVSGGGQSAVNGDTLGNRLVFSLYVNGKPPTSGYVKFRALDCDNNVRYGEYVLSPAGVPFDSLVNYIWQLNATVGVQTLRVYFLDSTQTARDSVTVTATGEAAGTGWHVSGCIFPDNGEEFKTLAELPSGRVLGALLNISDYPFYSDDDGASWHRLTTFPRTYTITKLLTTAQNEVFAGIQNVGVYYSNDGGQTWSLRGTGSSGLPTNSFDGDVQLTQSGQLFTFTAVGTYYSVDKGQTWSLAGGLTLSGFNGACSTTGGILFGVNGGAVFRSDDSGGYWRDIWTADAYNSYLMLADGASNLYIGGYGGIYASADTGNSWTHVYPAASAPGGDNSVYQLTKENGTFYFYSTGNYTLTQTTDFVNFSTIQPPVPVPSGPGTGRISTVYLVTQNGHYILSTDQYGVWYFNP